MLSQKLLNFKGENPVVYALPRGGVVVASEIAEMLGAPLDLVITRKICHPYNSEYAIAAVSETGKIIKNESDAEIFDSKWFGDEVERQKNEMKRRRQAYLKNRAAHLAKEKIAIIVDDGLATGLTMRAAILQIRVQNPQKIVVAVPVAPQDTAQRIEKEADEFIALEIDKHFLGAIGAYYENFDQVSDEEVVELLASKNK